ncbi:MAG: diacylglycerol kinase [Patescibacteria group bacterium]|jgi:diacylglycerol kinase
MIRLRRFVKSFRYALLGLRYTWRSEQNFRFQVFISLFVFTFAFFLGMSALRFVVLMLLVTLVLVLELLNTFFEKLIDLISPKVHAYAAMLKDILAASVLVASIGAAAVGIVLFWPYL